jgi:hypothetical protein
MNVDELVRTLGRSPFPPCPQPSGPRACPAGERAGDRGYMTYPDEVVNVHKWPGRISPFPMDVADSARPLSVRADTSRRIAGETDQEHTTQQEIIRGSGSISPSGRSAFDAT